MCISEAKESRYFEIYKNDTVDCAAMPNAARRLIIFNEIETLNYSSSKLRGLLHDGVPATSILVKPLEGQLSRFKLLRVLYLRLNMSEFPGDIKSLIHLRYLELFADNLKVVPSWISHLRNLQTFIITAQHLQKNLQTLQGVAAGEWIGKMLPMLTNLRDLNIKRVSNDHADALSSSLPKLSHLASLTIQGDEIPSHNIITAFSNQHSCLKNLSLVGKMNRKQLPHIDLFPQRLVGLYLDRSELEEDPMETLEKLQFLERLQLICDSYKGKRMLCSATGFPQLLSLDMWGFYELEEWKIEEKAMPCLKYLNLLHCEKLKIIQGLKNVPLDELILSGMSEELKTRFAKDTGEDWDDIKHVPYIDIS
ncbi:putative leucine-rich repeat domain superfamily [Dioscorea sansibarensis]